MLTMDEHKAYHVMISYWPAGSAHATMTDGDGKTLQEALDCARLRVGRLAGELSEATVAEAERDAKRD